MVKWSGTSDPATQRNGSTRVAGSGHLNPAGNALAVGPSAMETADGRTIGRARSAGNGDVRFTGASRGAGNPVR